MVKTQMFIVERCLCRVGRYEEKVLFIKQVVKGKMPIAEELG